MIPQAALNEFCDKFCSGNPELVATAEAAFVWFNKSMTIGYDPKRPALTTRQQQLLDFILQSTAEHGIQPTRAEMAKYLGVASVNAADCILKALEKKGYIERRPGKARAFKILQGASA